MRRTTGEWYWLEIIGFWTPEYVANKLDQLEKARLNRLILCVDESRQCAMERFQRLGNAIQYRRNIDVRDVLSILDPTLWRCTVGRAAVARQAPKTWISRALGAAVTAQCTC